MCLFYVIFSFSFLSLGAVSSIVSIIGFAMQAQAIMVLAGRARTWASSNESNVLSECGVPSSISKSQPVSRAGSPSPQLPTKPECVVPNVKRPKTIATRG